MIKEKIEQMNIKELIKEHHKMMIEKGFHDIEKRGISKRDHVIELIALIGGELLGEALESHRCGRFAFYNRVPGTNKYSDDWNDYAIGEAETFEHTIKDTFEDEIADCFLRMFDLCGYLEISDIIITEYINHQFRPTEDWEKDSQNIAVELFCIDSSLHYMAKNYLNGEKNNNGLITIFRKLWNFCNFHNIPIEKHIKAKMAYNRTRPHKYNKEY